MNSYTVSVKSPSGTRDTFRTNAASPHLAREIVRATIMFSHPNWSITGVVKQ